MWYKYSQRGKLVDRSGIPDMEKALSDFINQSVVKDNKGISMIDFDKLNSQLELRPEFKKYINKFVPVYLPGAAGGYYRRYKQVHLPVVFSPAIFSSIIHETVHGVHFNTTRIEGSKISQKAWGTQLTPSDLGKTYKEFYDIQLGHQVAYELGISYEDFLEMKDQPKVQEALKRKSFAFRPELTEDEWENFNKYRKNVKQNGIIYYGLEEELPAHLSDASRLFSAANLKRVYKLFYKGKPNAKNEFLKDIREAFSSQSSKPVLSEKLRELRSKILQANPGIRDAAALDNIILPNWWSQFAKNLFDNYDNLLKEFKPSSVSKVDIAINARAAKLKQLVDANEDAAAKFIKARPDLFGNLNKALGKSFIGLGDMLDKLNLSSPLWQLAEPVIEILLIEFGKYLENPSAYSSGNQFDYVNKKIDDILSDKSISNKYKYFIDNFASYKKSMDSSEWEDLLDKLNSGIIRQNLFNKK